MLEPRIGNSGRAVSPGYSSPVVLDGRIEVLAEGSPIDGFPGGPDARPLVPLPQLDPSPGMMGNGDGQFDWVDVIEEYAGRATRGDMPAEPHETAMEDRSWLRIDHWRTEATWLPGSGDRLGLFEAAGSITLGIPKVRGLTVRPGIAYDNFKGPNQTDLPSDMYTAEVNGAWMYQVQDRLRMRLSATVGVYSDLEGGSPADGLRISGGSLFTYECNPDVQLVFGTAWINLENRSMLPIGGIVWYPRDDVLMELIFPEGRVSTRLAENSEGSRWLYLGWGFFGRTWHVERLSGDDENATYQDWRLSLGMEWRSMSGMTAFTEAGYVFNRELEFESGAGTYDPGSVIMLRGGVHF